MQSISNQGPRYRTRLLAIERAAAFARCLGANARYCEVAIEESRRAQGVKRYYVTFLPVNPARIEAILHGHQEARRQRARDEGVAYVFAADPDHPSWWCFNPASGETYQVTRHDCSCPDFAYRCGANGMACKHQLALNVALACGELEEFESIPSEEDEHLGPLGKIAMDDLRAERRAAVDAELAAIFGE